MTEDVLIDVKHVSKCYKVSTSAASKLINAFIPAYQRGITDFWALKDVSFQVKRGEAVAIIGRNGSGKSTLLEIITGTRKPTSGEVSVKGRIAALLQLGSGFNPEFTGRENVVLNGLMLGLSRQEVEAKLNEIIAFADIGDFIEQPVKNYSSGMLVRLAFSVQVALVPDILIIDEALSVGDFFFQQKCATRMRELRKAGTTILFVSHSMASVREVCDRAIVLRQGDLIFAGDCNKAIRHYLAHGKNIEREVVLTEKYESASHREWVDITQQEEDMFWQHEHIDAVLKAGGLLGVAIRCEDTQDPLSILIGEKRTFRVYFKTIKEVSVVIQLVLKDSFGNRVYTTNSSGHGYEPFTSNQKGIICLDFTLTMLLSQAGYSYEFLMREFNANVKDQFVIMKTDAQGPLDVKWGVGTPISFNGKFGLPTETNIEILGFDESGLD